MYLNPKCCFFPPASKEKITLNMARLFVCFNVLDDMMLETGCYSRKCFFFSFVHVRHVKQGET